MAEEVKYNNTLVSGRADETLTYTKYVKDDSSGKSTKELLDEKVNKTDQLGTTQIADKAVTTEKLDAASVTTDKVADANITTSKLADSSVETEKINNKAVTTDKLNDGAVDNSKLSPNSVTSEKIKDESIITEKLNDRAVTTEKVEEKAITNQKLGDQSVDGRVVREASLESKHFANESVTTEKIARKSITKDKLADNSVDASQVVDGSIGNAKLSPDSVTTEKIKDSSVTNEKVADDTLGIEKFDPELRKTIQAATGLPDDLSQMIQDVDKSVKQLKEKDTDLQSQINDKQQQITANDGDISLLQTRSTQMEEAIKSISASGGASQASAVTYENTESGLDSLTAQSAIDELANKKFNKENIVQEFGESKDKVVSQFALPFRYIQNEEFIFAKVDTEDKLLFGIQWDGTPKFGKTSEVEDRLQSQVTLLAEKVATILGDGDTTNVIDTMNELKKFFADIGNTETLAGILTNLENVAKNLDKTTIKDEEGNVLDTPFRIIENEEFIKAIVDSDNKVLFGFYRATGEPYCPLNEMYHVIQNKEYFAAWLDADDKVVFGIRRDGEIIGEIHAVNALKQVISSLQEKADTIDTSLQELLDVFSLQENPEYMAVEKDADGKVLSATYNDGSHYFHNAKSETIPTEFEHIEDPEGRIEITTDAENKVLSYRDADGKKHEHDMQVTNLDVSNINLQGNSINDIGDALKANGFKLDLPSDFSKKSEASVPYPAIPPIINIISENGFPMSKTANFKGYFEYYDNFGNYFKKPAVFNAQGNSSLSYGFPKTNLAVDLLANEANDSDSFSLKIGNWVPQDSFHFKAYYTDAFKCVNLASYDLNIQMWNTMEYSSNRPWKKYLLSEDDKKGSLYKKLDILNSYSSDPRCVPDGFPVMLLLNSKFYGLYQMQIKKHRDNYAMNKKNPLHIQLDGNVGSNELFGKIDWTKFEIRNPKSLICSDGSKYDGDNPSEITGDISIDKNTSQVKKSIERFADCINVFKKAVADSKSKEEIQELISSYLDIDYTIDYILETNIVQNYDSRRKNVQWCTWNGTIWVPCPYDQDQSFKGTSSGFMIDINLGIGVIQESEELPFYWVYTYFIEQVKLRYKYLVSNGIFTKDNLFKTFIRRVNQIGEKNYSLEYKKWNESPCHRSSNVNTEYWVPTFKFYGRIAYGGYYSTTEYKEGDYCYVGENVYRCKKACKNIPVSNTEYWENVTYDNTKTYSIGEYCAYGERDFCIFKAIKETTGNPPLTKLYEYYPKIMGFSDSIYRIESFCKKVIDFFNNKLV